MIFPSVGYFCAELAGEGRAGLIERYRKEPRTDRPSWRGWETYETVDREEGPHLPMRQRPEQVLSLNMSENRVNWTPSKVQGDEAVVYDVCISRESRGWSYEAVPVGHDLMLKSKVIQTVTCSLPWTLLPSDGLCYISIVARLKDRPDSFYLPSEEFIVAVGSHSAS
jgi:hypothetical protein